MKLREQRATIWEQMKALSNLAESENRDFSAEEAQKYERMEADLDSIGNRIDRSEKMAVLDSKLDKIVDLPGGLMDGQRGHRDADADDAEYGEAFNEFMKVGISDMSPDARKLMAARRQEIKNAQGVGSGSAGGYTVPPAFRAVMVETMKAYGAMMNEAELITTDSGVTMPWPTNDDTGNIGEQLGENTAAASQDIAFGQGQLDAYTYSSKIVLASLQFIQDSNVSDVWLAKKLGQRIGRILSQKFTVGTGTTTPDGLAYSATIGVTGTGSLATTTGIAYDNLIDLQESLDPAYGGDPNCKWMMHQTMRKVIRKLKDGQNRPLWEPSLQAGMPDMLMGRPVVINNDMATLAQNSLSLGYGNIRQAYVTRNVNGSTLLLRLTERYAEYGQVGYLAFDRWDGTLQDAYAFKTFKTTATA